MSVNVKEVLDLRSTILPIRKRTDFLVIHCSATPPSADVGAKDIHGWHTKERHWKAIGYHYVIRRDGTIERGRPMTTVGAHVAGNNSNSIGICLVGGTDKAGREQNNFTAYQFEALKELLKILRGLFPAAEICGHRDFSPDLNHDGIIAPYEWIKFCPSFDAKAWAKSVGLS